MVDRLLKMLFVCLSLPSLLSRSQASLGPTVHVCAWSVPQKVLQPLGQHDSQVFIIFRGRHSLVVIGITEKCYIVSKRNHQLDDVHWYP